MNTRGAWRDGLAQRLSAIPIADDRVRSKARWIVVDDLAAASWGSRTPETRALATRLSRGSGEGECALLVGGRGRREDAATLMAVAACWDELDGGYRPAAGHGGLYTVPAAVAEAEAEHLTLDELLDAVVVGYEVVAAAARMRRSTAAVHPHSALAPLGAAAAVAWLRHREVESVLRAVDVAATLAPAGSNAYTSRGSLVRNLWAGAGARTGFLAADAASAGLTAPPEAVDDHLLVAGGVPDDSARCAVLDAYHKPYGACQYTHSAIEAAAAHTVDGPIEPRQVAEVVVSTHPLGLVLAEAHPRNPLAAAFSIPHLVAAVLVSGRTDAAALTGDLDDARVRDLRGRVVIDPTPLIGPPPHDRPARVVVRFTDGGSVTHVVDSARGGPDKPMGLDDLLAKVSDLTARTHPAFGVTAEQLLRGILTGRTPVREVLATLSAPRS